jgi:hypothetical protein
LIEHLKVLETNQIGAFTYCNYEAVPTTVCERRKERRKERRTRGEQLTYVQPTQTESCRKMLKTFLLRWICLSAIYLISSKFVELFLESLGKFFFNFEKLIFAIFHVCLQEILIFLGFQQSHPKC